MILEKTYDLLRKKMLKIAVELLNQPENFQKILSEKLMGKGKVKIYS